MVVAVVTAAAAIVDIRTRRIPNWLTFGAAAIGISMAVAHVSGVGVTGALGGLAVGLLLMMPGHVIGSTGAGDVKLLAAIGTLLGPASIALAFLYTGIAGAAIALIVARQRGGRYDTKFAYAPAIAIGTVIAAFSR